MNFPEIETPRLLLNQVNLTDISAIVEYAGNPKVAETTFHIPHPYQRKNA